MNRAIAVVVAVVCFVPAAASNDGQGSVNSSVPVLSDYTAEVWTPGETGLPHGNVSSILRTDDGYLWLGTWNGLVRFDGVRFTPVRIPNVAVTAMHKDRHGAVWIATDGGGVVRWQKGQVRSFTEADGLSHDNATSVGEDASGNIWVGTVSGLNVIAGDRITVIRPVPDRPTDLLNFINVFTLGPSGRLWIGTRAGLCEARGLSVVCRQVPVPEANDGMIRRIYEDRQQGLWLGTDRTGLVHLQGSTITRYTACAAGPHCVMGSRIGAIHETRNGDLWIGFRGDGGLNRLRDGAVLQGYGADAGLPRAPVQTIFEDPEGSLWIGTDGGGLVRLRRNRVAVYTRAHGMPNDYVMSLAEDADGHVWAAANCGPVSRMDADGRFHVLFEKYFTNSCSWTLQAGRDGSMWIGASAGGLFRWHNDTMTHWDTSSGLSDNSVLAMHEDSKGALWIGTDMGDVHRLLNGTFTNYGARDGLLTGNASALAEDRQGRIWLGFNGRGLASFANGRFERVGVESGLTTSQVSKLHVDSRGVLRVGTLDQGLFRLEGNRFIRYAEDGGLQNLAVSQILEDATGNLWVGTNRGIVRLRRPDLDDFAAGRITSIHGDHLGREDGMLSAETTGYRFDPSGLRTRDGRLWFATIKGLVVIDPAAFPMNEVPPPVLIEQARVDGREAGRGEGGLVRVPAGTRSLDLEYTAFSMAVPARVRFRYRLVGFDDAWQEAGARRTAFYTSLPPAEYRFEVLAANNDGVWSPAPAIMRLVVEPLFWERRAVQSAALALLILATGLVVLGGYRLRVRHVFARNVDLERRVADRTRELSIEHERLGEAHGRLELAHDNLVATLSQLQLGIVMTDGGGVVTLANDVARTLLARVGVSDPVGAPWKSALPLAEADIRSIEQAIAQPAVRRDPLAVILEPEDGRRFALEIDVRDDPRDPERRLFVLHDVSELYALQRLFGDTPRVHGLVGRSRSMQLVFKQISDLALVDTTVLIDGETGTGKELVARAIHDASPRSSRACIGVNCGGLTESLLASQLFGHRRGAFTGAVADQVGYFEAANGGTLFFDEIGDMPLGVQASLLRALQEREIMRVGDSRAHAVDVRVIAATHRNLAQEVAAGRFREDLYYRIRVARVALPPLRERRDDVPLIAAAFVQEFAARDHRPISDISVEAMQLLKEHEWPGNVRELRGAIETAVITCKRSVLTALDLPPEIVGAAVEGDALPVDAGERGRILAAIDRTRGNRAAAARLLGIGRTTLYRKLKALGLEPDDHV
jgi:DNA-binding NtrC family response regulator/ligand-binding sensor domain-containing protein